MRMSLLTAISIAFALGACTNTGDPMAPGVVGYHPEPVGNCRYETPTGSNIRTTVCGPERDDTDKLRTKGGFAPPAGHLPHRPGAGGG
jgi:hypothetical protein